VPAPLLVVVDMQDVFRDLDSPWATPTFDAAMAGIDRLLEGFGERVRFTRFVPPKSMAGSWGPYYETFADVLREDRRAWWGLASPYRERAKAGPGPVVRSTFSAWDERLREAAGEPPTIVLGGVATDCCVISTALAAVDGGAFVRLAADACGGSSEASHEAAITVMRGYAPQIEISSVDRELERLAEDSR
jgi:nicotinamidase-related amidase